MGEGGNNRRVTCAPSRNSLAWMEEKNRPQIAAATARAKREGLCGASWWQPVQTARREGLAGRVADGCGSYSDSLGDSQSMVAGSCSYDIAPGVTQRGDQTLSRAVDPLL